jgi:uncharacterized tellurite resistance protein B-like protein
MFTTLKSFLEPLLPQAAPRAAFEHTLQVATAVLLVEVMRSDASIGLSERAAVIVALRDRFALSADEVEALMVVADQTAREAHDLHTFTSRLNDQLEPEQKARIVEYMWQVAYADGRLDAHEQHVMRKLADLLYIPHGDYIAAKMRARDAMTT